MRFDWADIAVRAEALARPRGRDDAVVRASVGAIVDDVRLRGWPALVEQALRIDGHVPEAISIAPYAAEARRVLPGAAQEAMLLAARAIETFHRETVPVDVEVATYPGVSIAKQWRPLGRVGLYVPGGRAPLFSTLLMLAIPARVAGVSQFTVVTPPRRRGGLDLALALAAELAGIETIWGVGGAQAVAALAYGAGDIRPVDMICGPGNAWVSAAKSLVSSRAGGPGIDLPAGPSELMVIADDSANPRTVAADLLSQAEHDRDAQVLLVSPSSSLIEAVEQAFDGQASEMGGRFAGARFVRCADLAEAVAIANAYAPEHLSLACQGAEALVALVHNAGAIFVGHYAAESFGDYLAGSSHVLPTDGAARYTGGISTMSFMKAMSVQQVTAAAAAALATPTAVLARIEGLEAHARAAEARRAT